MVLLFSLSGQIVLPGQVFQFPSIPDTLTSPGNRGEYLLRHFWEHADFSSNNTLSDSKIILDYLFLLKNYGHSARRQYINNLIERTEPFPQAGAALEGWLLHFLHNSRSPFYDDELYLCFLEEILASNYQDNLKEMPRYMFDTVNKNRVGFSANDFSFMNSEGKQMRLSDLNAELIMLFFTNPTCAACIQLENQLTQYQEITRMVETGSLLIVIISPTRSPDAPVSIKQGWIRGYDMLGEIFEQHLYEVQYTPCIYLLGEKRQVLLKEADSTRLFNYLLISAPSTDSP